MRKVAAFGLTLVLGYSAFGLGELAVFNAYCEYRVSVGKPSDLPCNEPAWDMIVLPFWPVVVLSDVFSPPKNAAVPMPIRFRVIEVALLVGYLTSLVWVYAAAVRSPSSIKLDS